MCSSTLWIRGAALTVLAGLSFLSPGAEAAPGPKAPRAHQGRAPQEVGPSLAALDVGSGAPGPSHAERPRRLPRASLEPQPLLDEPFGDAIAYQQTIDRFTERTAQMRRVGDDFARAVQETLSTLGGIRGAQPADASKRSCPASAQRPFARAHALGQEYLRVGRELSRYHAAVRELDRLGDSVGLTPDYRARVKQVLHTYDGLLSEYREMKAAFHDQLSDELRFLGCDPAGLLSPALAQAPLADEPALAEPPTETRSAEAKPTEVRVTEVKADAKTTDTAGTRHPTPAPEHRAAAEPLPEVGRAGIRFYVDNSRCQRGHRVFVDGRALGEVAGAARRAFQSTPGPHEICLVVQGPRPPAPKTSDAVLDIQPAVAAEVAPRPTAVECGAPGTIRRSYLHDGWTIALRCE